MFSTLMWFWSIGLLLAWYMLMREGYCQQLHAMITAHPNAKEQPGVTLFSCYIVHMFMGLIWPATIILIFREYGRIQREKQEYLKRLRHWSKPDA